MSDRRRIIAALRAKAVSTTFPAEAETLRAKADDLEAKLRAGEQRTVSFSTPRTSGLDWTKVTRQGAPFVTRRRPPDQDWRTVALRIFQSGDVFTAAGGWRPGGDYRPSDARDGSMDEWMTVTDVNGRTHRERIY